MKKIYTFGKEKAFLVMMPVKVNKVNFFQDFVTL